MSKKEVLEQDLKIKVGDIVEEYVGRPITKEDVTSLGNILKEKKEENCPTCQGE